MIHLLVIALFAAVLSHELFGQARFYADVGTGGAIAITLGSVVVIWLSAWIVIAALGRHLERRGDARTIAWADIVVMAARIASVGAIVACVLFVGWLDAVREVIGGLRGMVADGSGKSGDLVAVDELIAILPGLIGLSIGWWVIYPIDRFVREATLVRDLDSGHAVHPILPRGRWTWQAVRHHVAIVALPIMAIVTWSEAVVFAARARFPGEGIAPDVLPGVQTGIAPDPGFGFGVSTVQLVGAIVVLAVMPVVMCRVWDTVPLRGSLPGQDDADDLHTRLMAHCTAARVRVRGIRVWRTGGAMVNGAVIGMFGPLRYVLLTDALLERLARRELEAVMAHEVAHIKLRHMPWLVCAVLGTALPLASGVELLLAATNTPIAAPLEMALVAGVFAAGLGAFGFVSRRFEWQADAYAATRMSAQGEVQEQSEGDGAKCVTLMGADAMIAALQRVADLNHVPTRRRSWRHGSILHRQERLYALVGVRTDSLPIDRLVNRIKLVSAVLLAIGLLSMAWSASLGVAV